MGVEGWEKERFKETVPRGEIATRLWALLSEAKLKKVLIHSVPN